MKPEAYIAENEQRWQRYFPDNYDPISGAGSPIPRKAFQFSPDSTIYLPETMFDDAFMVEACRYSSFTEMLDKLEKKKASLVQEEFIKLRFRHDFEFWAYMTVPIQDKETKNQVRFKLRAGQRKLLAEFEKLRRAGKPIHIVLLKARQWGGSTLTQVYMGWIKIIHKKNWHSGIVTEVEDQAKAIRGMFTNIVDHYPKEFQGKDRLHFSGYQGSTKIKQLHPSGAIMRIGSMERPDTLRSGDYAMLHLSEVGLWKKTAGKSPLDLIQSLLGALSEGAYTMLVEESTAKGVGNYFHKRWIRAINGKTNSQPVFVAFFEIELYQDPFDSTDEMLDFIESMSEYERELWSYGATLESIKWYRKKIKDFEGERWRMNAEYPPRWQDAFQSTGQRVFPTKYIQQIRRNVSDPKFVGDLIGDSRTGPDSLNNLIFQPSEKGKLKIWIHPDDDVNPDKPVKYRFCMFADIGGASEKADKSDITVVDRLPLLWGGVPEIAANWNGNIDQDIFAWICAQVGTFYGTGLFAIESNSLERKDAQTEGDHQLTILDEIKDHYPNLFRRTTVDRVNDKRSYTYGFHTNKKSKTMIMDHLKKLMREDGYVERDEYFCDEADTYEIKENGSFGAVEGNKDDRVVTRAGALWLALEYNKLPVPEYDVPKQTRKHIPITSEAMI